MKGEQTKKERTDKNKKKVVANLSYYSHNKKTFR